MSEHLSAHLKIQRPVSEVFDFVRRPEHHTDFDASGMVGRAVTPGPIRNVGDVFTMEMTYTDAAGRETRYRTDNHVTAFEPGRLVEWAVAPAGGELLGWRWRYAFHADGDAATVVTETYDWAGTSEQNRRDYGVPAFKKADLEASLALLQLALVAAHGDQPRLEGD
ncbi:SRPBCC family protein [Propioniciclava tarda]|uniref:Polyketide cyclase n=1 Tax=Propioniciclava tarda TaxID=433330 RepID=A0A4Q9KMA4_PROTD|nr:SRPBCC family protein [Propioniciclava tarda]TBT95648.1 polyketide cyclase [Propioniciclava tarda]SMO46862.1 Polyketide cyclase / dehydrase and lipid transport [Propioniciclava tarda]HOA87965.1 SRPBCC family protein [Propioniciclava tarda]HQA29899.1 SRPBCC family protein [Propioniciclava tarda]HQD60733.1 SRPBCC family protein [Propioniciclava tarda]